MQTSQRRTQGNGESWLLLQLAVGMLKAEIKEYSAFARAATESDGGGDAGHDLQSVAEIVGPTHAGVEQRAVGTLRLAGSDDRFGTVEDSLQQEVNARRRQPNKPLAEVVAVGGRLVAGGVFGGAGDGRTCIPVGH